MYERELHTPHTFPRLMLFFNAIMSCCIPSRDDCQEPYIIDVVKIIEDHTWDVFWNSRTSWQKVCIRRKDFQIEVPMNYFHFDKIKEEVWPRLKPSCSLHASQPSTTNMASYAHHHMPSKDISKAQLFPKMALSTEFSNNTEKEQTYKFRFEKTRKASLAVTFQRGFTIGGKANFSVGLPKVVPADSKVGGEVDMHVNVSKSTGEVIEETLTWEATSEIHVAESSNYTAKVLLLDSPVSYNFKLWTKMSMPVGAVPVTIRRKNDSFHYTHVIENLTLVFQKQPVEFLKEVIAKDTARYSVVFETTGIIEGVRLSGQKILLEGNKINARLSGSVNNPVKLHSLELEPSVLNLSRSSIASGEIFQDGEHSTVSCKASTTHIEQNSPSVGSPVQLVTAGIPIIEEIPEDDGGVTEADARTTDQLYPLQHLHHQHPQQQYPLVRQGSAKGTIPKILTTASSSLASSPMSEKGSPDISETSRKTETITTV